MRDSIRNRLARTTVVLARFEGAAMAIAGIAMLYFFLVFLGFTPI